MLTRRSLICRALRIACRGSLTKRHRSRWVPSGFGWHRARSAPDRGDLARDGARDVERMAMRVWLVAALAVLGCGPRGGVRDVNGDGRVVISCLGDSNTETQWPQPGTRRWCEFAAEDAPGWVFRNHAVGGTTVTEPGRPAIWAMLQLDAALAEDRPDAVVFAFGTNDVRAGRPTGEIVAAYRTAVERAERAGPLPFVALAPPIYSPEPDHRAALEAL